MTDKTRGRILTVAEERNRHLAGLLSNPSGLSWCVRHTALADEVVRLLYEDLLVAHPDLPPLALIATGGYGRRELSTHSDIDITVVPSDEASPVLDQAIKQLFQDLHWAFETALRMEVGYAYRLLSDAPGLDAKTQTGLMDMRLVAGSHELSRSLEQALIETFEVGEFVLAKVKEREEMFAKYHDSPLVVEPNLKEGAGGIRCFHCANWLREAIGERAARPTEEYDHVLKFRNLLHLNAGKHQDDLSRGRQAEIADQLALDMFEMMSSLVQCGAALHDHYRAAREKITQSRFRLARGVLAVQGEARLVGDADAGEAAVGIAIGTQLDIEVADIAIAQTSGVRGPAALYAISTGETTLRNLDRCGLLGQLLPELSACRTLLPVEPIHEFTVFEHTMRVIRCLDSMQPGEFYGDLKQEVNDLGTLYLAALLHDVGKYYRGDDHSVRGAEIARSVCERWELGSGVTDTVEWLVREHLTMAKFVGVRDVSHPKSTEEFAGLVKDPKRLLLLTLLTYADVSTVAEGSLTRFQDSLFRELFTRTDLRLRGGEPVSPDPAVHRKRLLRQLRSQREDAGAVKAFVESLPAYYLTSTHPEVIRLHMGFARKAMEGSSTVELNHLPDVGATEITVCTRDAPGLLSKLLGVFYVSDLSVAGIQACTTMTKPPVALDVFTVSFSGRPVPAATMAQVTASVMDVIEGRTDVEALLLKRGKDPARTQQIERYTFVEGAPGILEIRAPRGRGMAYRFSRLIADQGWNVVSARVGQWAGSATAAFYVLGAGGRGLDRAEVDRVLEGLTATSYSPST